jgi:hypothetical protein
MAGAVDLSECHRIGRYGKCRCDYCAVCEFPKHMAIHAPLYGQPPGSRPWGHEFVSRESWPDAGGGVVMLISDYDMAALLREYAELQGEMGTS